MEHEPDGLPVAPDTLPKENKVFCFLDANRPCSAECSAYKTAVKFNQFLDPGQQNCVIMQSTERAGRSLNAIASLIHNMVEATEKAQVDEKNRVMDEQRAKAASPPQDPRGPS